MSWIQTYTGRKFDLLAPEPEMVDIVDIAHALANVCRFGGHTREHYSVAQHSWIVSHCCEPWDALWGLLHDAAEAYLGDMVRPLKALLPEFERIERRIEMVIATRFDLIGSDPNEFLWMRERVKRWDDVVLMTEKRDLLSHQVEWDYRPAEPMLHAITPLTAREAERAFLRAFERHTKARYAP